MALTHVCVWVSEIGYRHITVGEACEMYPYGVSASRGHFVCELCAQNVGFSIARVDTGTRYFFHSSAAQNKNCEDRQIQLAKEGGQRITSLNNHTMPIRLVVTGTTFSLQLGFFFPPGEKIFCEKIRIASDSHRKYEYSFERIERVGTTYLSVGSVPSRTYGIEYVNGNNELKKYWSDKVQGISRTGTFFDCRSGQMLQSGGKAYSANSYYLLQSHPLYSYSLSDIESTEIARTQSNTVSTWYLYKIRIKRFSESSAKFFLKYSLFLTERPTKFYPIWPPYIEDPYFICQNASEVYLYLSGDDAELKTYPATAKASNTHDGRLYKLYTRDKEQLISIGKSGALGFSYLIKHPLLKKAPLPFVMIFDCAGNVMNEETYSKLPKSNLISISCPYDGKAVVQRNGKIDHIYKISAEKRLEIDDLTFGTEIHFYQGCDCVRTVCFKRQKGDHDILTLDDVLVKKLMDCSGPVIPVTHAVGSLVNKYATYPKTKQWISKMIKTGEMPRLAYYLLQNSNVKKA